MSNLVFNTGQTIQVKLQSGKIESCPAEEAAPLINAIQDDSLKDAVATVWWLVENIRLTDKDVLTDVREDGSVMLFWRECYLDLCLSDVFGEFAHFIATHSVTMPSFITEVAMHKELRSASRGNTPGSVYPRCFVVEFTPPHNLSKRALHLANRDAETIARYQTSGSATSATVNTYTTEVVHPKYIDYRAIEIPQVLVHCLPADHAIVRAFTAFCQGIRFPKAKCNLNFVSSEPVTKGDKRKYKCLTLLSDPVPWATITLTDFRRLHRLAVDNLISMKITLHFTTGTIELRLEVPEAEPSMSGSRGAKRGRGEVDNGDLTPAVLEALAKKIAIELKK